MPRNVCVNIGAAGRLGLALFSPSRSRCFWMPNYGNTRDQTCCRPGRILSDRVAVWIGADSMSGACWIGRVIKVISGPFVGSYGVVNRVDGDTIFVKRSNSFDTFSCLTSEVKTID